MGLLPSFFRSPAPGHPDCPGSTQFTPPCRSPRQPRPPNPSEMWQVAMALELHPFLPEPNDKTNTQLLRNRRGFSPLQRRGRSSHRVSASGHSPWSSSPAVPAVREKLLRVRSIKNKRREPVRVPSSYTMSVTGRLQPMASDPRSSVRIRMHSSRLVIMILPSPIFPVLAPLMMASMVTST